MASSGFSPDAAGLRPARLAVGLISAGRVGTALGEAAERAGHVVVACAATSRASRARAASRLPDTQILPAFEVAAVSELLILAVPDDQLPDLVRGLAAAGVVRPRTIVVHTSGASGIAVLSPLTDVIAIALHPAMTFLGERADVAALADTCFGITAADPVGEAVAQSLVLEFGGEPVLVSEEARPLYHAALAHGANHLVTLVADAVDALKGALGSDVPVGLAEQMISPLVRAALDNTLERGQGALTGPVVRGDAKTVAAHLAALAELNLDVARNYRAMSLRTAQRSGAAPKVFAVLEGWQ